MSPLILESTTISDRPHSHHISELVYFALHHELEVTALKLLNAQLSQAIACSPRFTAACWHEVSTELLSSTNHSFFLDT